MLKKIEKPLKLSKMNSNYSPPQVTVLLPVYNSEKYIAQAIESILNQTFRNFELLIIDDGSEDSSVKIVQSYSDPRIRIVKNLQNLGLVQTLNRGITLIKSEYLARMDADDIALPDRLEKQLLFMQARPEVGLLGGAIQLMDENGDKQGKITVPINDSYLLKFWLHFENVIKHPTVMLRTELLVKTGIYDADFIYNEDFDLWTRFAAQTEIANLPDLLLYKREHSLNISVINEKKQKQNHIRIVEREVKHLTGLSFSSDFFEKFYSGEPLPVAMAKKIIWLYHDCTKAFNNQNHLTDKQMKKLKYSLSWRTSSVLDRTSPGMAMLGEKISMYWHNHDLLVSHLRQHKLEGKIK